MGYQDPKSGGDTWGGSERFTAAQINIIAENQRHFALTRWLSLQQLADVDATTIRDMAMFQYPTATASGWVWVSANDSDLTNMGTAEGQLPNMQDTPHGLTLTNINSVRSVATRTDEAAWFGLSKLGGTPVGYVRWTGPTDDTWSTHNRATATGSSGICYAMASSGSVIVSVWDTGDVERNASGTTWTAPFNAGHELNRAGYGNGRFVVMGSSNVSHVYTSTDGSTWGSTQIGATLTGPCQLAFDYAENKWYILDRDPSASSLTIYTSSAPNESWSQVPTTANPNEDGPGFEGFAANGGMLAMATYKAIHISKDLGQNWVTYPFSSAGSGSLTMAKLVGGRFILASSNTEFHCSDPFFEPFPGQ